MAPRPWGPGATAALGLVVAAVYVGVQLLIAAAFAARLGDDAPGRARELLASGTFLSVSVVAGAAACTGLVLVFAALRRGITVPDYLRLRPVGFGALIRWLAVAVLFALAWDLVTRVLGRPVVPEFMIEAYRTADSLALLWIAIVLAAPVFEETFFRGFLLTGWQASRLGARGAVILTAVLWAGVHIQYDAYEIGSVAVMGILLGLARVRTGSLFTALAMHACWNVLATLQAALVAGRGAGGV